MTNPLSNAVPSLARFSDQTLADLYGLAEYEVEFAPADDPERPGLYKFRIHGKQYDGGEGDYAIGVDPKAAPDLAVAERRGRFALGLDALVHAAARTKVAFDGGLVSIARDELILLSSGR